MSSRFMTAFDVELKKNRHRMFFLLPLGFLLTLMLWSGYSNHDLSPAQQAQGYQGMFYELPIMNCLLMPIYLAIIASRLCDMERKGETYKILYTLEEKHIFYDCKFLHELLYLLAFTAGEGCMFPLFGRWYGYTDALSVRLWLLHIVCLLLPGICILTLQHILSLLSEQQLAPLFLGLAGSFVGLLASFSPTGGQSLIGHFIPWSYFAQFLPYYMTYDPGTRTTTYTPVAFPTVQFALFLLFTVLFYAICRYLFIKKEV